MFGCITCEGPAASLICDSCWNELTTEEEDLEEALALFELEEIADFTEESGDGESLYDELQEDTSDFWPWPTPGIYGLRWKPPYCIPIGLG